MHVAFGTRDNALDVLNEYLSSKRRPRIRPNNRTIRFDRIIELFGSNRLIELFNSNRIIELFGSDRIIELIRMQPNIRLEDLLTEYQNR